MGWLEGEDHFTLLDQAEFFTGSTFESAVVALERRDFSLEALVLPGERKVLFFSLTAVGLEFSSESEPVCI